MSVDKSVEEIKRALGEIMPESVTNADGITSGSGAYGIDMIGAASLLRLETPWTDRLPRMSSDTGLSAQWHEILLSTGRMANDTGTAQEGKRGGIVAMTSELKTAPYKEIVKDGIVTDTARLTMGGILDPLALNMNGALIECKRAHHMQNLFGRGETLLGTAATPTLSAANGAGGAVPAQTNSVIIVALNGSAERRTRAYAINGSWTDAAAAGLELNDFTRTNGDDSTTAVAGGTSIKSSAATQATTGGASTLTASWVPTPGACGYAVFVGVAGSECYQGTTQLCSVTMTLLKTSTAVAASKFTADKSKDVLEYDGIITQLQASGSGAFQTTIVNGQVLTSGADFTIDQFEPAFAYFFSTFDGYSPDYALVSGKTKRAIAKALLSNSTASRAVMMVAAGSSGNPDMSLGQGVLKILNPYTNTEIEILVDPYMPDGKVVLGTYKIPTQFGSGITAAVFFRPQQEFRGETWARRSRKWENSVSLRGALCTPWRAGHAVIDNVQ